MKPISQLRIATFAALTMAGCGPAAITLSPIENTEGIAEKTLMPDNDELKTWPYADLVTDSLPGMSVDRAYSEILNEREEGEKVIIAFIGSGIDIEHEDLKNVIWTNEDEIPDNNKDDDQNGYVDDIHGWNFLGDAIHENMELVRIIKKGDDGSEVYKKAKAEHDKAYAKAQQSKKNYQQAFQSIPMADALVKGELGKKSYTKEDLNTIRSQDQRILGSVRFLRQLFSFADSIPQAKKMIRDAMNHFTNQLNYHYNTDFDGRSIVGDDPDDINDRAYGNNNVMGPDSEGIGHGTSVVGIAVAQRNNNIGIDGIASNVEIIALRAVPDGDEYDKDVALAIRYAVDNGAKIINISFNKYYSPHADWVHDAIKYAASKDVLIVNVSGFNGYNLDEINGYPNDAIGTDPEIADNFLTVGGLNFEYGEKLVSASSDYGKYNVDVFAPGMKIWSVGANNSYGFTGGTSMAAAAVSGIAAVIRSQFPKLNAAQVKRVIMDSGLPSKNEVILGGKADNKELFSNISASGKMANLYNALILADKVSRGKVRL